MVLLTMIARVADGLPLAASMQEDEQVNVSWRPRDSSVSGFCEKASGEELHVHYVG